MGSSESEDRSEPKRSHTGLRGSSAEPSRRASSASSSRSQAPGLAPPLPAAPAPSSQRPQRVTVETETVPSVPTVAVVSSAANGSLRAKRSQESVPRVSQARATKKRSQRLTQGSKADIFAAKVANAVDEQDTSDSDETFVYDTTQAPPQLLPAPGPSTSGTPSLAGDSLRRPYRRTGSTASTTPAVHTPLNMYENGYFASMSSHPGYDTDDYAVDREDGAEDQDGTVSHAWPTHYQQALPPQQQQQQLQQHQQQQQQLQQHLQQRAQVPIQQPLHQSPRSFVVPKQALVGRQKLPPSPYTSSAPPMPSQESSAESFGVYMDPEQIGPKDARPKDARDAKDPRIRPYYSRSNSRVARNSARSSVYADEELPPARDSNNSIRAKTLYLQRWRMPAYGANAALSNEPPSDPPEELDERASLLRDRPSLYNYHARSTSGRRKLGSISHAVNDAAQASPFDRDAEYTSNFSRGEESVFGKLGRTPLSTKLIVGSITILICLLSLAFVVGLLVAASQPLKDFSVLALSDVFVSDKELVFSMILHARNPGIFARSISEGELDIFATSNFLDDDPSTVGSSSSDKVTPRTVLLGTVHGLESPITFHTGLRRPWKAAQIKLVGPLANNTAEWSDISGHEFDLTVKGYLSYNVLGSEYRETVSNSYHVPDPSFLDGIHPLL